MKRIWWIVIAVIALAGFWTIGQYNGLVTVENYPNLKADANFRALQDELAGTENRIATSRRDYNGTVQAFNARIRQFPTNIVAGLLGFSSRDYFRASESAQTPPQVQF